MRSALYTGVVKHKRLGPRPHAFRYRMHLVALDLEELPRLFERRWLWSLERFNVVSFRRSDYLGPLELPLDEAVRERVDTELGRRPSGRIRLVTQLRTLGYAFNPVSFYFCENEAGELDAIVAEITNTPWGERRAYVLDASDQAGDELVFRFDKDFHVSPFFDLDQVYEWRFSLPGGRLEVSMTSYEGGSAVFHAGLSCERRELTGFNLALALVRFPIQPLRLHAAIYWQALRLFLKRTPFFVHPKKRLPVQDARTS